MNNEILSNGSFFKNVTSVGELVEELKNLDPSIPVKSGFSESADLVVLEDIGSGKLNVTLQEGGSW